MRKLVASLVVIAALLGVVGTAAAEGGSIVPWTQVRPTSVQPMEGGSIVPWQPTATPLGNGTLWPTADIKPW